MTRSSENNMNNVAAEINQMEADYGKNFKVIPPNDQIKELQTILRDKNTSRSDFKFYADRLIRLVIEESLNQLPYSECSVVTPTGAIYDGLKYRSGNCGVSIVRSGEAMEKGLRECCRSIRIGKILVESDAETHEAKVVYARFPEDVSKRQVLLMYPIMSTGNTVVQAVNVLKEHGVPEQCIILSNLFCTPIAAQMVITHFPELKILTSEIHTTAPNHFGQKYFANDIAEDLRKLSIEDNAVYIEKVLEKFIQSPSDAYSTVDIKNIFLDLLTKNTPNINQLVVKCIAETTKNANQRIKFSNSDVLEKLMDMLDTALINRDMELVSQSCRALGNIFYSNDDARNIIFHHDGGEVLLKLLSVSNNEIKSAEDLQTFSKVRSGVLSNYLLGNEELSQKAIEMKIIEKVKVRIDDSLSPFNDAMLEHLLPILSILTEQVSDLVFNSDIIICIAKIFKSSTNSDVTESCLELFQCQAENDDIKLLLAKEGVCEHIFKSIEKYKTFTGNVDLRSLVKLSCDLIVLILTGDEAMHYLNETSLLSLIQQWLDSSDEYLMTTSVLALGNYARTDNHCIKMVEDKIMLKLMDILKRTTQHDIPDTDSRLQHSLLSAIRNLVIPKENKKAVIESGLVDIIIPLLNHQQPHVVFKVLGTLRMLIDGQDELALKILGNAQIIEKCVEWAKKTPDMVGVNSEASRLLAWLIKNGYRTRSRDGTDSKPLEILISVNGSIDVLVKMLSSTHVVMQNEAVIALTISSMLIQKHHVLNRMLIEANIADAISEFICRISETERITNEIIDNLSTLITVLKKSEELKIYLEQKLIDEKSIPRIRELATL